MTTYLIKVQTKRIAETFTHFQTVDAEKSDVTFGERIIGTCEHRIDLTAHITECNEIINKFN